MSPICILLSQHLEMNTYYRMHETRRKWVCVCARDRDSETERGHWACSIFPSIPLGLFHFPFPLLVFFVRLLSRFVCCVCSWREGGQIPAVIFCCFSPKAAYYYRTGDLTTKSDLSLLFTHPPHLCFHLSSILFSLISPRSARTLALSFPLAFLVLFNALYNACWQTQ